MADYLFYTYFEENRENFIYKDLTFERSHTKEKDSTFLESLLRFTYLDIGPMEDLFKKMDKALLNFYRERDLDSQKVVMSTLEALAKKHIYFEFLRLDWQSRFRYIDHHGDADAYDILPHKQLRHIPSDLDTLQKQIMRLFEDVLDIDDGKKKPVQEKLQVYPDKEKRNPLYAYQFKPISTTYERTGNGTFAEVLHPTSLSDLV